MRRTKSSRLYARAMALALALAMALGGTAFAEVKVAPKEKTVVDGGSITVNVTGAEKDEEITVLVYDTKKTRTEIKSDEILYANQQTANDEGNCTFTFRLPENNTGVKVAAVGRKSSEGAALTTDVTIVEGEYEITFENYNGDTLQTGKVKYKEMPVYNGDTPTHPEDDQYTYTFDGWDPAIAEATAKAVYTAKFKQEGKTYPATVEITEKARNTTKKTTSWGITVQPKEGREIQTVVIKVSGKTVMTYSPAGGKISSPNKVNIGLLVKKLITADAISIYVDDVPIPANK